MQQNCSRRLWKHSYKYLSILNFGHNVFESRLLPSRKNAPAGGNWLIDCLGFNAIFKKNSVISRRPSSPTHVSWLSHTSTLCHKEFCQSSERTNDPCCIWETSYPGVLVIASSSCLMTTGCFVYGLVFCRLDCKGRLPCLLLASFNGVLQRRFFCFCFY